MGGVHAPPPKDYRVQRCERVYGRKCRKCCKCSTINRFIVFAVPEKQLTILWNLFLVHDHQKKGLVVSENIY